MGKTLLSFEGTHFIKGTKICDLTNDECDNIKNSIVYLYSLSKEDNLFVYHCLNYINLRDTIAFYRNSNATEFGINTKKVQLMYDQKFLGIRFLNLDILRCIGNFLSSLSIYFDSNFSKQDYDALCDKSNIIFFFRQYRNFFVHQLNLSLQELSIRTSTKDNLSNLDYTVSKERFLYEMKFENTSKLMESRIRSRIIDKFPEKINILDSIETCMMELIELFYQENKEFYTFKKTQFSYNTITSYTNGAAIGLSVQNDFTILEIGKHLTNNNPIPKSFITKSDLLLVKNIFLNITSLK